MSKLTQFLIEVGAFDVRHSGRSLGWHLLQTYKMLFNAGCSEDVCLAGGLHSIYGTNAFRHVLIPLRQRAVVAQLFGAKAERLAFLFCTIDRPKAIEIGSATSKLTGREIFIDDDINDLRLIEAANLLEQGESLDRWPQIKAAWEKLKVTA